MNSMIDRILDANERERRALDTEIKRTTMILKPQAYLMTPVGQRGPGRDFSPEAIIKWFFTWTLCVVGFMAATTLLTTLGKLAKLLAP